MRRSCPGSGPVGPAPAWQRLLALQERLPRSAAKVPRRRAGWLAPVAAVLAVVVGGAVLGLAWRLLAPLARAQVVQGQVLLSGHQELQVAQDGWFALVTGLAGVVVATLVALRGSRRPMLGALASILAVALAGVVAWRVGVLLGPASLVDQVHGGSTRPLTPLALHTPSALLVGPLLCCLTAFLAALFTGDQGTDGPGR